MRDKERNELNPEIDENAELINSMSGFFEALTTGNVGKLCNQKQEGYLTGQEYHDFLERKEIPPLPLSGTRFVGRSFEMLSSMEQFSLRQIITEKFNCWTVIDQVWTKELADWIGDRKVLEIMAGYGWLAKALQGHSVDILATEMFVHPDYVEGFTNIIQMDAVSAVRKHGGDADILLVSWPQVDSDLSEALEGWDSNKPIIYIGERPGGCTGGDDFHAGFTGLDENHPSISLHQYSGMHDVVHIGYYKP